MMADHGEPCGPQEASYCLHGGTCFRIPTVTTPSCMCAPNYRGSRCNEMQLPSSSPDAQRAGIIAAVVIVVILVLVTLSVVIYHICRRRRQKVKSNQNNHQYWKVERRV